MWKAHPTPIFDAITSRNPENLRILLNAGADLKTRDSFGNTPFASAAASDAFEDALILLEAGADFRVKDDLGSPFSHFFTDEYVNRDPKGRVAAMSQRCKEFMEKRGVDFAKEKIENDKIDEEISKAAQRKPRSWLNG